MYGGSWRNNDTGRSSRIDPSCRVPAALACNTKARPQGGTLTSKRERQLPSKQKWNRARLLASRLQYVLGNGSTMRLKHIRIVGSSLKRHTAWKKIPHVKEAAISLFHPNALDSACLKGDAFFITSSHTEKGCDKSVSEKSGWRKRMTISIIIIRCSNGYC